MQSREAQGRRNILRIVVQRLLSHRPEIWKYPLEQQHPFSLVGLRRNDSSRENLKKLLVFGLQWRGGPRLSLDKINRALSDFNSVYAKITEEILPNFDGQKTTNTIYKRITLDVKYIGPKIAGVFLRDTVYHIGIWRELLPFLYLPIDRHIRDLLIDRLGVFNEREVPKVSESFLSERNQRFQKELAEIHTPRVDFDDLWFVGSQFCSFRKLCPICWIRDLCRKRFENVETLSL